MELEGSGLAENRSAEIFAERVAPIRQTVGEESWHEPWLFQHQSLTRALESARRVDQETLANTLNYIHFRERSILVHLRHPRYEESILVRVYPEKACLGTELTCCWSDENLSDLDLESCQFLHLIIDDGLSMILVPGLLQEMNGEGLTIQLPDTSYAVGKRGAMRYDCREVKAGLTQAGFQAEGELLDFSSAGFRIRVRPESSSSFHWFNSDELVTINLRPNQQILFDGQCRCIRERRELFSREIVLTPVEHKINRFREKPFRNHRQRLVPSPTVIFDHPLFKRRVQLEVNDISTLGFSVCEKAGEGVLMKGMIIPDLTITYAGALRMRCTAKVVYCLEEKEKGIRNGLTVLDMDIDTYSRWTHILTNAMDPHTYISNEVDMDSLWEFFFDTGFIYPMKYRLIQSQKENLKETYRKLYQENPEIARHFTYQKNGKIYGHISMVRAYERTWMIQHHAARAMDNKRPAFMVLKQIIHYMNDIYRLPSAKTEYVMCYFRPENRFPDRVFGDFARELKNPRGCSMDLFSYLPYTTLSLGTPLPEDWSLQEFSSPNLWELKRFYNHRSGGLLLDVLRLEHKISSDEDLEQLYDKLGLKRRWKAYSLTHAGNLNALLIVNQSDLGLNLSELLNGIKILVTNPEDLPWEVLSIAIGQLVPLYNMDKVPVLIYPLEYVEAKGIPYEKQYHLWIYDARFVGQFREYLKKKFKISYWE